MQKKAYHVSLFLLFLLSSCISVENRLPEWESANFTFDATNFLENIRNGNENVLIPIEDRKEFNPEVAKSWKQDEYLSIAEYIFDFYWKDNLEEWQLIQLTFNASCRSIDGMSQSGFKFFRANSRYDGSYLTRVVDIDTRNQNIYVREEKHHDGWFFLDSIDLQYQQISAEDAIKIADNNGGLEKRTSVNNNCSVFLMLEEQNKFMLFPNFKKYNWNVSYSILNDRLVHEKIFRYSIEIK